MNSVLLDDDKKNFNLLNPISDFNCLSFLDFNVSSKSSLGWFGTNLRDNIVQLILNRHLRTIIDFIQ